MSDSYSTSFLKENGLYSIWIAVIIVILVPLFRSVIFGGNKKVKQRGVPMQVGGDPTGLAMLNAKSATLIEVPWEGATTMAALFEQSWKKHSRQPFLGTRSLIGRDFITASDGRKFEKLHLGEYQWETYGQMFDRASHFASGLVKLGHDLETQVAIFSDTRVEWSIAFQGCFRQNITIVTIYASLGEEALIHSLNETQVSTLICDSKQFKKLAAISSSLETLKNIIYFEYEESGNDVNSSNLRNWVVTSSLGKQSPVGPQLPIKKDITVIMYTSGSIGLPKGLLMTHGNLVAITAVVMTIIPNLGINDVYLAYLPLAHVFELAAESVMMAGGVSIGYGSALTLTNTSNKIKKGTQGDASALKPTLMAAVPAILDRVRDGVSKKILT